MSLHSPDKLHRLIMALAFVAINLNWEGLLNFLQKCGIQIFGRDLLEAWSSHPVLQHSSVCTLLSTFGSQLAGRTCPGGAAAVPGL